MTCYRPVTGYRASDGRLTMTETSLGAMEIKCGTCLGCRLDRSRDWAIRCVHESQMHQESTFVTLTYDDDNIPQDCGLVPEHFDQFVKSLRNANRNTRIRYFGCGEYGDETKRPHYHMLIFGHRPKDEQLWTVKGGNRHYTSEEYRTIWKDRGMVTTADVTQQSAGYVARYIMKKIGGEPAEEHYRRFDSTTGETWQVLPEFQRQSTKPGIGHGWYQKYKGDLWPHDFCVVDGKKQPVPDYYTRLLKKENPELHDEVVAQRMLEGHLAADNSTERRLADRMEVKKAQIEKVNRTL